VNPAGRRDPLAHVAFALVMLVVAIGGLVALSYRWRRGAVLVGGALLLAAAFRAVLPTSRAGLLAIRSRPVDVLTYLMFGMAIVVVAATID
jgi:hypothetical protein